MESSINLKDQVVEWLGTIKNADEIHTALEVRKLRSFRTFGEAWISQLARIVMSGQPSSPRDLSTLEICGESILVGDLRSCLLNHPVRDLNAKFACAEFLWILSGSSDLEPIAKFNSQLRQFSDDQQHLAGAYGPRLSDQWSYIKRSLQKPDTRQAIATIWTPSPPPSKDIPCTVACQWLIRDGFLNLIVTMRSSDIWLGLPYDFFCFAQLTNWLAADLGLKTGWLRYQMGSSHLYADKLPQAFQVLERSLETKTITWPNFEKAIWPYGALQILNGEVLNTTKDYQIFVDVLRSKTKAEAMKMIEELV